MMMLGGVPINVTSPPRIAPNDSGISNSEGERSALAADCIATGSISASAPTLFMSVDSSAPVPASAATWSEVDAVARITGLARNSVTPLLASARLRTSTSATVIVAGWPKPVKASSKGTAPSTTAAMSARKATRS
jgi:hypothetical protein